MIRLRLAAVMFVGLTLFFASKLCAQESFTLEQVLGAPFTADLVAAKNVNRVAWTSNQQGMRNIWVAEGPNFTARQLTSYQQDDGIELSQLRFSADGNYVVYVRGEGQDSAGDYANPTSNPVGQEQTVWAISWNGGAPVKIDAGTAPTVSAQGRVAYARSGELWMSTLKEDEKPKQIVVRGKNRPVEWSSDGTRLLLVTNRGDHSFIGIYDVNAQTVKFLAPSVDTDKNPVWSPDSQRVAFVRQPAVPRDTPDGYFIEPDRPHPWAIWVADVDSTVAREIWHSGNALQDSFPYMSEDTGGGVVRWEADNRIVFASEADGWQHLYSISADGGAAKLLTAGNCEVEEWSFSPERNTVYFNSNCGDIDRRHVWSVGVDGSGLRQWTGGKGEAGIEWDPVALGGNRDLFYIASDPTHPGRVFHSTLSENHAATEISSTAWESQFPADKLVVPQPVIFHSVDGYEIHGQLFLPKDLKPGDKRAALIFLHGGPMRQMLLGWHYMYYYANAYAMNQYLANRGYVVLSINYRSGIGYGRAFREAPGRAGRGASEYQDVVAAGKYLQTRADVDGQRIGLWGGSYGGFLTALGLGHNSDLFAAGVDFHGVHDWPADNWEGKHIPPDLVQLAHDSSPVSAVSTWKSPVLFIHGDDDRNVMFSQTVDLVARLRAQGVYLEQLIFPDEVHDFLLYSSWEKGYAAGANFFDRKLGPPQK
ncbi:MAG TPA: prolyl oligopeptidase family serine peptidase [Candidatus Sulfotelmatobacter sp.]|nr:prolyl oligopeptidase family serine peptidase [Candidatus Sulfotelmatobacter sp.]